MKNRGTITFFLIIGLYFLLPVAALAQGPSGTPSVARGRALWGQNCLPCHGPTGLGDGPTAQQEIPGPLPNFADPIYSREMIPTASFDVIKNGRIENLMPPWGNRLSEAEMWDLTALVWQLGNSPDNLAAGMPLYEAQCAACHGDSGAGDGPEATAEINDFTDAAAMVQVSQTDLLASYQTGEVHRDIELSEAETWQTLDYIRTFSFAVPQRNGTLTGQAVNATTGEIAADVAITLRILDNDIEVETLTTQADSQGTYTFTGLPTDPNLLYMVEGDYENVDYQSEQLASFVEGSTETTLDLNVYETTTESTAITITQLHYIVAFMPDALTVLQIYVLGNKSNQTFVGGENGQTFSFTLPEAAENPTFQGDAAGLRFIETDSGFADTQPIVPGNEGQVIAVSYEVPFNGEDSLTLETPIPLPAESVSLLLQERQVTLESPNLSFLETRPIQGDSFGLYAGSSMAAGETLTLQLNNLDELSFPAGSPGATAIAASSSNIDQTTLLWIIGAVGLLAVLGVGVVYPLTRPQTAAVANDDDPERLRQKLLLLLARLDETFEAGEIEEGVYRRARAGYKRQLAALFDQYD